MSENTVRHDAQNTRLVYNDYYKTVQTKQVWTVWTALKRYRVKLQTKVFTFTQTNWGVCEL